MVKVLRYLAGKSVDLSALASSNIQLSLFFGEMDQQTKLSRLMKKILFTKEKLRKRAIFNEAFSLPEPDSMTT